MPQPDCKIDFIGGKFTHHPALDVLDEFGNVKFNATGEGVPRSRENGIAEMVRSVVCKHKITKDFSLHIRIADAPWEGEGPEAPDRTISERLHETMYSLCVYNERYKKAFPDFTYVGYPEAGLINYTETINSFIDTVPETNKIGWCGSCSCGEKTPRPSFLRMSKINSDILEGKEVNLPTHTYNGWQNNNSRMTYQDQINRWKYLIDIEGCGYSGRFKILMSTPRIVFFVDRPYQEWFFEYMIPWTHYVPVKRNLSDLIENYHKIEADQELQNYIKKNQKVFAQKYLTREAAENRIFEIIKEMIRYKNPR